MDASEFRALALDLPEAEEREHHHHPDFRVRGRVFASLAPDGSWAMVKLPDAEQVSLCGAASDVFEPFAGAWGRQGCTRVTLAGAKPVTVRRALEQAWRRTAPKELVDEHRG